MIFFWLLGDSVKLLFLLIKRQPLQFIIGCMIVMFMEILLFVLYVVFKKPTEEPKAKPRASFLDKSISTVA
jgi:hypothetical protein